MKNNKQKKNTAKQYNDEAELLKPKKKILGNDTKVNLKSKKFWEEIYDDEGDELERFLR